MDVAILEVGVGGRLDATNCIPKPIVCGVTSLGFDHMELLGHTLPVCDCTAICSQHVVSAPAAMLHTSWSMSDLLPHSHYSELSAILCALQQNCMVIESFPYKLVT